MPGCLLDTPRSCSRRLLHHLLPRAVDLDIENCMFVLISQMIEKLDVQNDFMREYLGPIQACADNRAEVCVPHFALFNVTSASTQAKS